MRRRDALGWLDPRGVFAIGAVCAFVLPSIAGARDPAPLVPVEVTACGEDIPPSVRERLAVEVEILWRESSNPPEMASLRVTIRCEGDVARIEVGATAEISRSSVDLTGLDREARGRLLALKATELIHLVGEKTWQKTGAAKGDAGAGPTAAMDDAGNAPRGDQALPSTSQLDGSAASSDSTGSPPTADQPPGASLRAMGHDSVSAGAFALFAGRPFAYFVGPSLAGSVGLLPRMSLGLDVDGTFGSLQQPDRTLHMRGAAGAVTLLLVGNAGSLLWKLGAGGRVGLMQMNGEPTRTATVVGKTATGIWAGPVIAGSMAYPLATSRWFFEVGAEGGLIALPLGALIDQQDRFYVLNGPWLGLHASLGLDLGRH